MERCLWKDVCGKAFIKRLCRPGGGQENMIDFNFFRRTCSRRLLKEQSQNRLKYGFSISGRFNQSVSQTEKAGTRRFRFVSSDHPH
jgi:hypothetical protein